MIHPVSLDEIESLAIGAWILGTGWRKPYLALLNRYRREPCCGPVPFDV